MHKIACIEKSGQASQRRESEPISKDELSLSIREGGKSAQVEGTAFIKL